MPSPGSGRALRLRVLVLTTCLLAAGCDRNVSPGNIGHPAPEFALSDGTHTVDLQKLRGRVVLLNLWASWCEPCVEELPSLLALQHRMPNLVVVAVSMDEDEAAYQRFVARNHVDLLNFRDPQLRVNALYGTVQIPETYIIDQNGILRRKLVNAQNWTSPEIVDYLTKLNAAH